MSAYYAPRPGRSLASLLLTIYVITTLHLSTAARTTSRSATTQKKGSLWREDKGTVNPLLYVVIGFVFAAIAGCLRFIWFFWKDIYNGKISEKALAAVRLQKQFGRAPRAATGDIEAPASPTNDHAQQIASYFQNFGRKRAKSPNSPTSPRSPRNGAPADASGGDKGGGEMAPQPKLLAMMAATSFNALRDVDDAQGAVDTQQRPSTSAAEASGPQALNKTMGAMGKTMRTTQAGAGAAEMSKTKTLSTTLAKGGEGVPALSTTAIAKGAGTTTQLTPTPRGSTTSTRSSIPTSTIRNSLNTTSALAAVATTPRPPSPNPSDTRQLSAQSTSSSGPTTPLSDGSGPNSSRIKLAPLPEKRAPPVPSVPLTAKTFSLAPAGVSPSSARPLSAPTASGGLKRGDSFGAAMAKNGRLNMSTTLTGGKATGGAGGMGRKAKKSSVLPVDMGPTLAGMRSTYRQTKQHK